MSEKDVDAAFNCYLSTAKKFPVLSDIIELLSDVTVYQMNYGPDGWGGHYAEDHPYVQHQRFLGVPLAEYAVKVRKMHAHPLEIAAMSAQPISMGDDDPVVRVGGGGGFKRLSYGKN